MDPVTLSLAAAIAYGLGKVGEKIVDAGLDIALEPAQELLKKPFQRGYRQAEENEALLDVINASLIAAGAPVDDSDALKAWLKRSGLARLQAENNHALRRQFARANLQTRAVP